MQTDLRNFISHVIGVMAITLVPVIVTAFVSMPLNLNRHPGEPAAQTGIPLPHMT